MKSKTIIQIIVSFSAISLIIAHLIWPQAAIDGITLGLIMIVIIPWLSPLFKTLELPGGVKLEYQELEKAKEKIVNSGLLKESINTNKSKHIYVPTPSEDPTLTLAWLRIEIEKRLRAIARLNKLPHDRSMRKIMLDLVDNDTLSKEELAALADVTGVLNKAIHGIELDRTAADWALNIGPDLLNSLDSKIKSR